MACMERETQTKHHKKLRQKSPSKYSDPLWCGDQQRWNQDSSMCHWPFQKLVNTTWQPAQPTNPEVHEANRFASSKQGLSTCLLISMNATRRYPSSIPWSKGPHTWAARLVRRISCGDVQSSGCRSARCRGIPRRISKSISMCRMVIIFLQPTLWQLGDAGNAHDRPECSSSIGASSSEYEISRLTFLTFLTFSGSSSVISDWWRGRLQTSPLWLNHFRRNIGGSPAAAVCSGPCTSETTGTSLPDATASYSMWCSTGDMGWWSVLSITVNAIVSPLLYGTASWFNWLLLQVF